MARRMSLRHLRTPTLYTFGEAELLDLDDRTAHVLRMRSGMWDGQLYTLREVGEEIRTAGYTPPVVGPGRRRQHLLAPSTMPRQRMLPGDEYQGKYEGHDNGYP
jgi:hypothetical protein